MREFEARVAAFMGKKHGVMVSPGSSALMIAMRLARLPRGSEVITPALTFWSDVAAIYHADCTPVFVDVGLSDYQVRVDQKGALVSVSAVLPGPVATRIFADAAVIDGSRSAVRHRSAMEATIGGGLTGRQAADRILPGIAAGEFWVSTHPEITAHMAKQRAEYLTALATPALTPETRALL